MPSVSLSVDFAGISHSIWPTILSVYQIRTGQFAAAISAQMAEYAIE